MNEFLTRWPDWFSSRSAPSCGWTDLLIGLCNQLEHVVGPEFKVLQVKEKFGSLRFYAAGANEEARKLIDAAEDMSSNICEECGAAGRLRGGRWYKTLCDEHERKRVNVSQEGS